MNRLFCGNFDFEYQLRGDRKVAPAAVRRRNTEFSLLWILLADSGDWLEIPSGIEPGFFDRLRNSGFELPRLISPGDAVPSSVQLCPWGWTADVVDSARRRGVSVGSPLLDIVRAVNSRRFSVELETEWGVGLQGTALIHSETELNTALRNLLAENSPWLLKANFGMAGRERIRGEGRQPTDQALHWFRRRLAQDGVVIFEPFVNIVAEAGLQFVVPKTGPPKLLGITPLISDATGTYRGSRFDDDPKITATWSDAVTIATHAAERIQSLEYFGPLGVDAAKYRTEDGTIQIRPLQDINARFTMGRLCLGLRRYLQRGETVEWGHQHWPTETRESSVKWFDEFRDSLPASSRAIRTSPFEIDGNPVAHGTVAIFHPKL